MSTHRKLAVLAGLYLAQGLPYGFFTQALPVLLRDQGVSLEHIGLTSLLMFPWALKFLWAPWVDRTGSRRQWVLGLQTVGVLLTVMLSGLDPGTSLVPVLAAVCLTNLVAASQDVATDGMAVQLLLPSERGHGNGIQVAGYRSGMILGGGALLVVHEYVGWSLTFLGMACLLALSTVPLWLSPGVGTRVPVSVAPSSSPTRNPWGWVTQPGAARWMVVLFAYKLGDYLAQGMIRPWMVDLGLGTGDIGWIVGVGGFGAGLVGAVVGGYAVRALGSIRALHWFGWLQCLALAGYAVVSLGAPTWWSILIVVVVEHLIGGIVTVALFTAMMSASRTATASTDFTLQASVVVLASGLGATLSGFAAAAWGYGGLFCTAAALATLGPLLASRAGWTVAVSEGREPDLG